jgi:hypothetical protein
MSGKNLQSIDDSEDYRPMMTALALESTKISCKSPARVQMVGRIVSRALGFIR